MNSNFKKDKLFRVIAGTIATAVCAVSISVSTKLNPNFSVAIAADESVERYEIGDYVEMSSKSEFWNIRKSHEFGDNIYETKLQPNQQFLITEEYEDYWFKVQIDGWDETETYIQISPENSEWFKLNAKIGTAKSISFEDISTTTALTTTTTSETTTTTAVTTTEIVETAPIIDAEPAVFSEIKSGDSCFPIGELTLYSSPRENASTLQTYEHFSVKKVISEDWIEVWVPKSHKPYYIKDNNFYVASSNEEFFVEGAEITFIGNAYEYFSVKESTYEAAEEVGSIDPGDSVVILDKFYDDWYYVGNGKVTGFIKMDYRYFAVTSMLAPVEPIATSNSTTSTTSKETITSTTTSTTTTAKPVSSTTTTTSKVDSNDSDYMIQFIGLEWNIRKSADITSDIIGVFESGDVKYAIKKDGDWYQLADGGWIRVNSEDSIYFVINKKYEISFDEAQCGDTLVFVGEEWNIRKDSTTNSDVVGYLNPYDAVTILGFKEEWILTSEGWIGITDSLNFKFYRNL